MKAKLFFSCERCGSTSTVNQELKDQSQTMDWNGYINIYNGTIVYKKMGRYIKHEFPYENNLILLCPSCIEKYENLLKKIANEVNKKLKDFFETK